MTSSRRRTVELRGASGAEGFFVRYVLFVLSFCFSNSMLPGAYKQAEIPPVRAIP